MLLCQATCPHCRTLLFFPAAWRNSLLRCKVCKQVFREAATPVALDTPPGDGHVPDDGRSPECENRVAIADRRTANPPAIAEASKSPPVNAGICPSSPGLGPGLLGAYSAPDLSSGTQSVSGAGAAPVAISPAAVQGPVQSEPAPSLYEQILARRRRLRWIKLGVAAMILMTGALAIVACWPLLRPTVSAWWHKLAHVATVENNKGQGTDEIDRTPHPSNDQQARFGGADDSQSPHKEKPKVPRTAKRDFDGRALLIGIQNYFYLNPINSGALVQKVQDEDRADLDPLGFRTFRRRLVNMGFRDECIGELSDVAAKNPAPPLKASIEETIKLFCEESRPQDSILLAYVGHILVRDKKVFLAPIDAKEDTPPEKLVALDWLYQQLGQCKARHKVLILDVAHLDPQEGVLRGKEMPLPQEAEQAIAQVPEGLLVWLSCSANQFSYSFGGYGLVGSVFFHTLNERTYTGPDIQGKRNRAALDKAEPFPEWDLPLLRLNKRINSDVNAYLKSLGDLQQEPKLLGKLGGGPSPAPNDPFPSAVTVKFAPLPHKPIDPAFVDLILHEVRARLKKDRPLHAASLPPFWAKDLEKYTPEYADLNALKAMLDEKPLRKATFEALELLDKHERQLRMSFLADANVENFRKQIMREQENLAIADQELFDFKEKLDAIRKAHYEKETLRWRANFDLVYARFIGRMALYREYNFVIGNRLRRDPTLQNPQKNNGWKIVPSDRLQQKETRELAKERDKILQIILKEHPNTPWEFLAERERVTSLGLKVEEAKVAP